ncbi:MAG: MerR family transcriptional regulator [bacterium]
MEEQIADEYTEPCFSMYVASIELKIHPQTLRMYERKGLIKPARKCGQRHYSRKDIDDVIEIRRLTREFGVNLAGVRFIMSLNERIKKLEKKIREHEKGL